MELLAVVALPERQELKARPARLALKELRARRVDRETARNIRFALGARRGSRAGLTFRRKED
jgi:hypothetical protein